MIYCLVPPDLAQLSPRLRQFYRQRPDVEVLVDRRYHRRRIGSERRRSPRAPAQPGRRTFIRRNEVERRRGLTGSVAARLPLPRAASQHAERVLFIEVDAYGGLIAEDLDTAKLVRKAQAGDRGAIEALYVRYYPRVYRYLLTVLGGDHHEAEDVAHDTFASMIRALASYQDTGLPFRRWLFRIARNAALDRLRRGAARLRDVNTALTHRVGQDVSATDAASDQLTIKLADGLPLAQRRVLFLRYSVDATQNEAARLLGTSAEAVRKLESRAKRTLASRLAVAPVRAGD